MKLSLLAAPVVLLGALTLAAPAETFNFTLSSNGQTGAGTLSGIADPYVSGAFDITSGTGTYGSSTLSLVSPSGDTQTYNYDPGGSSGPGSRPAGAYYGYNNVLYTTGLPVDFNGLLFNVSGGSEVLNLFQVSGALFTAESDPDVQVLQPASAVFTFTDTAATPEPSSLVLLGTGALGLLASVRRRIAAHV